LLSVKASAASDDISQQLLATERQAMDC